MKCRRIIKDDKGQNYVVWFGAKQPKGTTNNNVKALEFEETVEIDNWKFDVYTQNLSNEVNLNLTEGSGTLSKEVDFWIPLEQTILSQSDVTFECQILNDIPKTASFMNVDISALPLTIDNLKPLEGSTIQLDTIKGRAIKWTQLINPNQFPASQTKGGITFTVNKTNGGIACSGTATEDVSLSLSNGAVIYFLPTDIIYLKGCPSNGSADTYSLYWANAGIRDIGAGIYTKINNYVTSMSDTTGIWVEPEIIIKSGTTINATFYPQMFKVSDMYRLGKEPATKEDFDKDYPLIFYPYGNADIKPTKVNGIKIKAGYQNLLDKTKFAPTQTINGVTFTNNGDGSYTLNGTASANAYFAICTFDIPVSYNSNNVKYLFKGYEYLPGEVDKTVELYVDNFYGSSAIVWRKAGEIISKNNYYNPTNVLCRIRVSSGYTCNSLVIKPYFINLTNLYGPGNEPTSAAQFNQDFPDIDNIPYPEQTISFPEQELYDVNGITKTKDELNIVKHDSVYELQFTKRMSVISDMSLQNWEYDPNYVEYGASFLLRWDNSTGSQGRYDSPTVLCPRYTSVLQNILQTHKYNKCITNSLYYFFLKDTKYTDVASFKEANKGVPLYYASANPKTTTIATLTPSQVTALFTKGYCVEILGNDDNNIIVRPDLSLIFNEFEAPFTDGVYFGLGNKKSGWVDEDNLEAYLSTSTLQTFTQSNTEYDITHLRLQFLEDNDISNNSSTLVIRFKISSKNKMNWYNENDKHDNYAEKQEGVATSLTQRLSVLKNELWYNVNEGLPLIDKYRNKNIIDSYVASTILKHPDVINISEFTSLLNKNSYSCKVVVNTIYGNVDLTI